MNETAPPPPGRYVALDSLRGICATLVFLYHLNGSGYVSGSTVARQGWLFVDFFFVLSGFVILASYSRRLEGSFPLRTFVLLRLGRLYPLHAAVLGFLAVYEFARYLAGRGDAWTGGFAAGELLQTLLFVDIFTGWPPNGRNPPSWSIAAEFWTYLIAAVTLKAVGWRLIALMPLIIAAAAAGLAASGGLFLNGDPFQALLRCIYGFAIGMAVFQLHVASTARRTGRPRWRDTAVEAIIVCACLLLAADIGRGLATLLCPPLFGLAVFTFARERGALSRVLRIRSFVLLGTLSYSIYLVHLVVLMFTLRPPFEFTELPPLVADAVAALLFAIVVGVAFVTYRLVERPARAVSRRMFAAPATQATQPPRIRDDGAASEIRPQDASVDR